MGQKEETRLLNIKGHAPQLGVSLAGTTNGWVLAWDAATSTIKPAAPPAGAGVP